MMPDDAYMLVRGNARLRSGLSFHVPSLQRLERRILPSGIYQGQQHSFVLRNEIGTDSCRRRVYSFNRETPGHR